MNNYELWLTILQSWVEPEAHVLATGVFRDRVAEEQELVVWLVDGLVIDWGSGVGHDDVCGWYNSLRQWTI